MPSSGPRELEIGGLQVFVLALVLPGEVAALPYVGIAFAAFERGDMLLKSEAVPSLVGGGGAAGGGLRTGR